MTRFALFVVMFTASVAPAAEPWKRVFVFEDRLDLKDQTTVVSADQVYSKERTYGFEPGSAVSVTKDGVCTSDKPFFFSVAVPEGTYVVLIKFDDPTGTSETTVKAEQRRLMIERFRIEQGQRDFRYFSVNVRTPKIANGGAVKLKDREKKAEVWQWDDKLTLEFNGTKPRIRAIVIQKDDIIPVVYMLGDSTVCDQPGEPYASWGQMLPVFFEGSVAVANHAQSGESLRSSLGARRLDKVLSTIKPGDWLMLQYGHNDMKAVTADDFKKDLKHFADEAKKKGAKVVLVTPMHRRTFKDGKVTNSHKDFPDAVRTLAKEESLPLIDLHAMSATLYESFGPEKSAVLFKSGDGTHHNNYGAYLLAQCVVEGISALYLEDKLHRHLRLDRKRFDPAKPEPAESFAVPASPTQGTRPDGK